MKTVSQLAANDASAMPSAHAPASARSLSSATADLELVGLLADLGLPLHMVADVADLVGTVAGVQRLTKVQVDQLGLPPQAARALIAAAKIARVAACDGRIAVHTPNHALSFFRARVDVSSLETEHAWVITLDARRCATALFEVGSGSLARVEMLPREVFRSAVRANAFAVVLLHNHPSNVPTPSEADILITERLARCGIELGVPVLDHLVVTSSEYVSFAELGLMPAVEHGGAC